MKHKDYNENILYSLKDFLQKNNIEFHTGGDAFRQGTNLIQNNSGVLLILYYYIEERNGNIYIQGFDRYIVFQELKEIISKVIINANIVGKDYCFIDRASFLIDESTNLIYNLDMVSSDSLDAINENLVMFYKNQALPFYEKWNSLNVLYKFIKDKEDREELNDILGQFWQFKKATILRLCNDENYQEYMDAIYEREKKYFEESPNDIDNIRYYNAAKELKELLDKTEPVYNV